VVLPLLFPPETEGGKMHGRLEVWKVADPPVLEEVVEGIASHDGTPGPFSVSRTGRLLWDGLIYRPPGPDMVWMDVYDFNEKRFLSAVPPNERRADGKRSRTYSFVKPAIAPNGSAVLRYTNEEFIPPAKRRVGTT